MLPVTPRLAFRAMLLARLNAVLLSRFEAPATVKLPRPSAEVFPAVRVPAFKVIPPRKPLAPFRTRLAAPFLVRLPAPLRAPPRVRSAVPPTPRLPARLIALFTLTAVAASSVVPLAALSVALPSAEFDARISPPAFSATGPRKALLPPRVRLAAPFLIKPPTPPITPLRVSALLPPTVKLPSRLTPFARVTAVLLSSVVPDDVLSCPLPRAVLLPTTNVPP